MRPQPRSVMPSITWRVTLNTLFRLVLIVTPFLATSSASALVKPWMPALAAE